MGTNYYMVSLINGDYVWLKRTNAEEEPLFIARSPLPEKNDEGVSLNHLFSRLLRDKEQRRGSLTV